MTKKKLFQTAADKGMFFEIEYGKFITDNESRSNFISNFILLNQVLKGNNLIISSGAENVFMQRNPEDIIEDYLDFTIKRLSKKYDETNPENMFFEDETYKVFLEDMRNLLQNEEEFKKRYCEVNHITSREHKVQDEQGETTYLRR